MASKQEGLKLPENLRGGHTKQKIYERLQTRTHVTCESF